LKQSSSIEIKGRKARVNLAEEKCTLWISNLPHDLKEVDVRKELESLLPADIVITSVTLKTGPPPHNQSRGFGFVTFDAHLHAENARRILSRALLKVRFTHLRIFSYQDTYL